MYQYESCVKPKPQMAYHNIFRVDIPSARCNTDDMKISRDTQREVQQAPAPPTCISDDCERTDIKARDLCGTHYDRWYVEMRTGVPVRGRQSVGISACEAGNCDVGASVRLDGRITCRAHEARWRRHGSYDKLPAGAPKRGRADKGTCNLPDCTSKARSIGGMCERHYHRNLKHGSPYLGGRHEVVDMTVENLLAKTVPGTAGTHTPDCKLWTGRKTPDGYAYDYDPALYRQGLPATKFIHRRIYELIHGSASIDGLTIDHRCHDPNRCAGGSQCPHRRCINPEHLVPETRGNNARRHSPIERDLSMLNITDPDEAIQHVFGKMLKPCGHFYPKYGPTCTCDQQGVSA